MFDWTQVTQDPSDKQTGIKVQAFLASLLTYYTQPRMEFLRDYFKGSRVMDIGAGEHTPDVYREDRWEHGVISKSASYAVGIEINQSLCDHYNAKGFHFKCVDATSNTDLGERFDLVFMGDVIEHVNNPVALLEFAKRHLTGGKGRILVSTPNPFCFSCVTSRIRKKHYRPFFITNFEHVSWITPNNAHELARRSGLALTKIYFPRSSFANPKKILKTLGERLFHAINMPELAHKEYIYEFTAL